ncbi:MAG: hypothetical protein ACTSW1_15350 [Candidatus Hodarchaeales archaeon]
MSHLSQHQPGIGGVQLKYALIHHLTSSGGAGEEPIEARELKPIAQIMKRPMAILVNDFMFLNFLL